MPCTSRRTMVTWLPAPLPVLGHRRNIIFSREKQPRKSHEIIFRPNQPSIRRRSFAIAPASVAGNGPACRPAPWRNAGRPIGPGAANRLCRQPRTVRRGDQSERDLRWCRRLDCCPDTVATARLGAPLWWTPAADPQSEPEAAQPTAGPAKTGGRDHNPVRTHYQAGCHAGCHHGHETCCQGARASGTGKETAGCAKGSGKTSAGQDRPPDPATTGGYGTKGHGTECPDKKNHAAKGADTKSSVTKSTRSRDQPAEKGRNQDIGTTTASPATASPGRDAQEDSQSRAGKCCSAR